MAKRKIIWANTAIKGLFAIFESDIRKNNGKSYSVKLSKIISKQIRLIPIHPLRGKPSSDESVRVLIIESLKVCYGLSHDRISIFTISESSK